LGLTAPTPQWLPSTRQYSLQLQDRNIFGGANFGDGRRAEPFWNRSADILSISRISAFNRFAPRITDALLEISPHAGNCWRDWSWFLLDNHILNAFEAGLGWFLIRDNVLVLTPRPAIRTHQERNGWVLHSTRGAAVSFAEDPEAAQWWLRGVRVQRFVVEDPQRITRAHIRGATTAAQRRVLIDQYGLLRYSIERGFKPVDHNPNFGATLYVKGGKPISYGGFTQRECIVELVNSTPEPDGSRRHFARRIPGHIQTAHEAVAWTFNLTLEQYNPVVQT
jgi:hypothetical protein